LHKSFTITFIGCGAKISSKDIITAGSVVISAIHSIKAAGVSSKWGSRSRDYWIFWWISLGSLGRRERSLAERLSGLGAVLAMLGRLEHSKGFTNVQSALIHVHNFKEHKRMSLTL
jgi:hypothetical protein